MMYRSLWIYLISNLTYLYTFSFTILYYRDDILIINNVRVHTNSFYDVLIINSYRYSFICIYIAITDFAFRRKMSTRSLIPGHSDLDR